MKEKVTDLRQHRKFPDVDIFLNDFFVKPLKRYEKRQHSLLSGVSDPQRIDFQEKTKVIELLSNKLDES